MFVLVEHSKDAQQFVLGGQNARRCDGEHKLLGLHCNAFYQRHQQGLLGLKVVIHRSFGDLQFIHNLADCHLFIAFGEQQSLSSIQDFIAPDFRFFDNACHASFFLCISIDRPTVNRDTESIRLAEVGVKQQEYVPCLLGGAFWLHLPALMIRRRTTGSVMGCKPRRPPFFLQQIAKWYETSSHPYTGLSIAPLLLCQTLFDPFATIETAPTAGRDHFKTCRITFDRVLHGNVDRVRVGTPPRRSPGIHHIPPPGFDDIEVRAFPFSRVSVCWLA